MDLTTALGLVAGSLTTLAYLPQVIKTWRSRSADGMSWSMLVILCIGIGLWLIYGWLAHDVPVIIANLLTLVFSSTILVMKIRYEAVAQRQASLPQSLTNDIAGLTLEASLPQQWALEPEVTFSSPEPEASSPVA